MKNIPIIALAVLLLASCQKENKSDLAVASHSPALKVAVARPFEVNLYTTVNPDPSIPPTACSGDLPGLATPAFFLHGTASHMGAIDASLSSVQDVTCNLSFATAILTTTVAGQIVAADGDKIFYTGADEINVINLLTNAGPSGPITGVWTINGGTGRFEGATGSFTINGSVAFAGPTLSFTGQGTITY
jgi:hypothetical protein